MYGGDIVQCIAQHSFGAVTHFAIKLVCKTT